MGWMSQRFVLVVVTTLALGLLASCSQKEEIRFRMTVNVQTPEGIRTGSSVMEISAWNNRIALNGHIRGRDLQGEAVPVTLPDGRILIALIAAERPDYVEFTDIVLGALDPAYKNDWVASVDRIAKAETPSGPQVVSRYPALPSVSNYPMLVSLRDSNSPASVSPVDPSDLAASFGPGFRMKTITFEATEEPLTKEIGEKLPWLQTYWTNGLTLRPDPPEFSDGSIGDRIRLLSASDFTTERPI